jgi:CRISPR/Cas system-associated exonuclease Cas4 (RecB family)
MSTPYDLRVPSRWAAPPKQFSFSSLQTITGCPRRWQLVHSEWGTCSRFPERAHPTAVEGQIVHEALDLLSRALGRLGRPPLGSPEFQTAAHGCGFWAFFETEVSEWNSRAAHHPRTGPGFVIRTAPRELANRAIRLFREQYRPGARHALHVAPTSSDATSVLARLQRDGALSEVRLEHPSLPLSGIIDFVTLEEKSQVAIVDFKTGVAKDVHREQLLLYAMLWWRVTGQAPARIEVQYLNDRWDEVVLKSELEKVERRVGKEIEKAHEALSRKPGPARAGPECARCPVRARCDDGWAHAEPRAVLAGRTADCEVTVVSAATSTGFTGIRRDGTELPVVYAAAVGRLLPSLTPGTRLRLVDAVPTEEGKALEIRAWSECYLA